MANGPGKFAAWRSGLYLVMIWNENFCARSKIGLRWPAIVTQIR